MSKASSMIIDNVTQRAIEQGKLDLRHASPALRQAAEKIASSSRRGGFVGSLDSLFGNNDEYADKKMAEIKEDMRLRDEENKRLEKEHQRWAQQHHSPNVPRGWSLLTDNEHTGVQSYSDGDRIHYFSNGRKMNAEEEYKELNRRYGSE